MGQPLPWEPDESPSPAQSPVPRGVSGPMKWNRSKMSQVTERGVVQSPESQHWGPRSDLLTRSFAPGELASIQLVRLNPKARQSQSRIVLRGLVAAGIDNQWQGEEVGHHQHVVLAQSARTEALVSTKSAVRG